MGRALAQADLVSLRDELIETAGAVALGAEGIELNGAMTSEGMTMPLEHYVALLLIHSDKAWN